MRGCDRRAENLVLPGLVITDMRLRGGLNMMTGDDQAEFEAFVARDSARLHAFASLLGSTGPDAEDRFQGALLRTARRWPTAQARPWAYTRPSLVLLER